MGRNGQPDPAPQPEGGQVDLYDRRYSTDYMAYWPPEKKRRVHDLVAELPLPPEGAALDFGCGNGLFTQVLSQALPSWRVYGADISRVAVESARAQFPGCRFYRLDPSVSAPERFDFLFTHHVLEHVEDVDAVWRQMASLVKPGGAMLHVLPCGDPGSFEHAMARLRVGGSDAARGNRFYYEEPAHLRRLTTGEVAEAAARHGFRLAGAMYGDHYHGAIEWITKMSASFVWTFSDPALAIDASARPWLWRYRWLLSLLYAIRLPSLIVERVLRWPKKAGWKWLLLAFGLAWPLSKPVDVLLRLAARREWERKKGLPGGSEMYLFFVHGAPEAPGARLADR